MSEILKMVVVDAATGEVIERSLTTDELAQRELDIAEAEAQKAETDAKVAARESALAKIAEVTGLTADEVAAL